MPDETQPVATPLPSVPTTGGDLRELFAAKAKARLAFKPIVKNKHVTVNTRDGRSYEFDYADLDAVLDACMPALAAQGLDLFWLGPESREGGGAVLTCMLTHASGAFMSTEMYLPPVQGPQERGSQITYGRRYQAQCILGVASEADDDGNAAAGNVAAVSERKPANAKPQAPKQEAPKPAPKADAPRNVPKDEPRQYEAPRVPQFDAKGQPLPTEPDLAPALAKSVEQAKPPSVPPPADEPPPPTDADAPPDEPVYEKPTEAQGKRIRELLIALRMNAGIFGQEVKKKFNKTVGEINSREADIMIAALETRVGKQP